MMTSIWLQVSAVRQVGDANQGLVINLSTFEETIKNEKLFMPLFLFCLERRMISKRVD